MSINDRISEIEVELKALSQKRKTLLDELRSIDKVEKTPSYGTRSNLPFSTPEERIDLFLNHFRWRQRFQKGPNPPVYRSHVVQNHRL